MIVGTKININRTIEIEILELSQVLPIESYGIFSAWLEAEAIYLGTGKHCEYFDVYDDNTTIVQVKFYSKTISKPEYIVSAANHYDDGKEHVHTPTNISSGFVVTGHRHHNINYTLAILIDDDKFNKLEHNLTEGFITNTNRFVNRKEALDIAIKANQILDLSNIRNNQLYSEDLY